MPDHDGATAYEQARQLIEDGAPADLPRAAELAMNAHRGGVPGAGVLYATCIDRMSLISGRPQRFGTVTLHHQGDLVMAPVADPVGDVERAALGVPSLAELRAEAERANRALAVERADDLGLPAGQRFVRIWTDPTPAELQRRWDAEGQEAWADDDALTVVCRGGHPGVMLGPVFQMPMWRVGDEDLFALMVRVERLPEAVFSYSFWPIDAAGQVHRSFGEAEGRWRGPDAPPPAPSNRELLGTTFDHAVESAALGEPRVVTVYRPPDHERSETLPVVYATDGGMFAPYARRVDAAIEAGLIPRVLVVAAHSAGFRQGNLRALEYLPGFDDDRFDRHQRFFVGELAAWAEAELGASTDRSERAVFGCSDGGGHALATGRLHRDRFGHVIAYSTGMAPEPGDLWDPATAPFVHLCAGTLEGPFFQATEAWAAWLHLTDVAHDFTERVCGHDVLQWCEELPAAVQRAWG